jgi:hypothetical protein
VETWQEQPSRSATSVADEMTSVRFAQVARELSQAAVADDLRAPAFRSPPRTPGLRRSIRRRPDGSATVSVSLRGRPAVAVVADMIDGVVAANEPAAGRVAGVRDRLWLAATPLLAPGADRSEGRAASGTVGRRAA